MKLWGESEGIAQSVQVLPTGCTGRGSNPGRGRSLSDSFRQVMSPTKLPAPWVPWLYPWMRLPRRGCNHSRHQAPKLKESRAMPLWAFVVSSSVKFNFQEGCVYSGRLKLFVLSIDIIMNFLQYRFLISQIRNSELIANYSVGMWKTLIYLYASKNSQCNSTVFCW